MNAPDDERPKTPRTLAHALALAAAVGAGDEARIELQHRYLGTAHGRALREAILNGARPEDRDLFARSFHDPEAPNAWSLLFAIAARSTRRGPDKRHRSRRTTPA